jgi:hypothetical protein
MKHPADRTAGLNSELAVEMIAKVVLDQKLPSCYNQEYKERSDVCQQRF